MERAASEGAALYLYKLCDEASSRPAPPRAAPPPHRPHPPPLPPAAAEAYGAAVRQVDFRLEENAQILERLRRRLAALQQAGAAEPAGEPAAVEPAVQSAVQPAAVTVGAAAIAEPTEGGQLTSPSAGSESATSAEGGEAQGQESRLAQRQQLEVYAARAAIGAAESCVAQVARRPATSRPVPSLLPP